MSSFDKDSLSNTFIIALAVCFVCSIIVSGIAVSLKPMQQANKELDQKQNILRAAGMLPQGASVDDQGRGVDELFSQFTVRVVDLDTGDFVEGIDPAGYDPIKAAKDPSQSVALDSADDIATLRRRENTSLVYLKTVDGRLDKVVLPVRGYGLWGTLFGYLALEGDLQTISGLGFYTHKETPGLGGEVDNPNWKAQWAGISLFDESGVADVRLVKRRSPEGQAMASREVDALSGATFTTRGVQNLVNFWTGDLGFGPFIENLKTQRG